MKSMPCAYIEVRTNQTDPKDNELNSLHYQANNGDPQRMNEHVVFRFK